MFEAIAFDTHRFVKNLMASDFTETQADRALSARALPRGRRVGGLANHGG